MTDLPSIAGFRIWFTLVSSRARWYWSNLKSLDVLGVSKTRGRYILLTRTHSETHILFWVISFLLRGMQGGFSLFSITLLSIGTFRSILAYLERNSLKLPADLTHKLRSERLFSTLHLWVLAIGEMRLYARFLHSFKLLITPTMRVSKNTMVKLRTCWSRMNYGQACVCGFEIAPVFGVVKEGLE